MAKSAKLIWHRWAGRPLRTGLRNVSKWPERMDVAPHDLLDISRTVLSVRLTYEGSQNSSKPQFTYETQTFITGVSAQRPRLPELRKLSLLQILRHFSAASFLLVVSTSLPLSPHRPSTKSSSRTEHTRTDSYNAVCATRCRSTGRRQVYLLQWHATVYGCGWSQGIGREP